MPLATAAPAHTADPVAIATAAQAAGFHGNALVTAVAVAGAESGFGASRGPSATADYGDWQINHPSHPTYDTGRLLSDDLYNAQAAYTISGGGTNWSPWTTYTSGRYLQFIPQAQAAVAQIGSSLGAAAAAAVNVVWPLAAGSYTQTQEYSPGGHQGVDLSAPLGTPIYAAEAGTIFSVGGDPGGFGNDYPVEQLPDGTKLTYGHASHSFVKPGQAVTAGQLIALVGSEGDSTGPHLHFQVNLPGGRSTDPLGWLAAQGAAAADTTAQLAGLASGATDASLTTQNAIFNPLSTTDWQKLLGQVFVIVMKGVVVLAGASMVVLGVASSAGKSVSLPAVIPIPA